MKLSISSGVDLVFIFIGVILVAVSCFFFYQFSSNKNDQVPIFKNLNKASPAIRKILDENRRIFINFGPNSSAGNIGDVREDLNMWEITKREKILPNNEKIFTILNKVKHFSNIERAITDKMFCHIESFKAHCDDPNFDYSQNQFPLEFSDLIYQYCENSLQNSTNLEAYGSWLKEKTNNYSISTEHILFFGSAMYGQETIDVDLLVKTGTDDIELIREQALVWGQLISEFKIEFGLNLHLTVFTALESESYSDFLDKLPTYKMVS